MDRHMCTCHFSPTLLGDITVHTVHLPLDSADDWHKVSANHQVGDENHCRSWDVSRIKEAGLKMRTVPKNRSWAVSHTKEARLRVRTI